MKITILTLIVLSSVAFAQVQHSPVIVAEVALSNQTGSTGGTLTTPSTTGLFRVSVYIESTGGNNTNFRPQLEDAITYTDDNGIQFVPIAYVADGGPQPPGWYEFPFKALANTPITWQVIVQPGDTSIYTVNWVLERLSPPIQ